MQENKSGCFFSEHNVLTMADQQKVTYNLSNGAIFNDFERPLPPVSRSRHPLSLKVDNQWKIAILKSKQWVWRYCPRVLQCRGAYVRGVRGLISVRLMYWAFAVGALVCMWGLCQRAYDQVAYVWGTDFCATGLWPGDICTITQTFKPIGVTVAEIGLSVPKQNKRSK